MEITYDQYQLIKFLSSNRDNAPKDFTFEALNVAAREFTKRSLSFQNLLGAIIARNSFTHFTPHQNYYLSTRLQFKTDSDVSFRNAHFTKFLHSSLSNISGNILLDKGQYVYLLLNEHQTNVVKELEGKYFAVALFKNNLFIGFEEGLIRGNKLDVLPGGYYSAGMDVGGYLSFSAIFLSYLTQKTDHPLLKKEINKTDEKIFFIE